MQSRIEMKREEVRASLGLHKVQGAEHVRSSHGWQNLSKFVAGRWFGAAALFVMFAGFADTSSAMAQSNAALLDGIKPQTGPARRWESGVGVTPYSQVNLRTGRVTTALPIIGWSGRGPGISFTLYHHMIGSLGFPSESAPKGDANFDGLVNEDDLPAFIELVLEDDPDSLSLAVADMDENESLEQADVDSFVDMLLIMQDGPVWTHTYDTCVVVKPTTINLIWGDGTEDLYTWNASTSQWDAPAGVFNSLVANGSPITGYTLTLKSKAKFHFLADGRLDSIEDPSGNLTTCHYVSDPNQSADGKLDYVDDSAGRRLDLSYNVKGNLTTITAPMSFDSTRNWELLYEDTGNPGNPTTGGDGYFVTLKDPLNHTVSWTYTADYDIDTITDPEGETYDLDYDVIVGRLSGATDPLLQTTAFNYYLGAGQWDMESHVTDVRGNVWRACFHTKTGNTQWTADPTGATVTRTYVVNEPPLAHEVATLTNPLNKSWTYLYEQNTGDVYRTFDPLGNRTEYVYVNGNLQAVIPPASTPGSVNTDKMVSIYYDDPAHPTSPTRIVEPADGQGNPAATTYIAYYGVNETTPFDPDSWNGLTKSVTDANGVQTLYEYDQWGQQWRLSEGDPSQPLGNRVVEAVCRDVAGNVIRGMDRFLGTYPCEMYDGGGGEGSGPEGGSGPGGLCIRGVCRDFSGLDICTGTCCCCAAWCEPGYFDCALTDDTCFGEGGSGVLPGGDSGDEGEGEAGGGQGVASFACPPFRVLGRTEGPAQFQYDNRSAPTAASSNFSDSSLYSSNMFSVDVSQTYDELGRPDSTIQTSNEPTFGHPSWPGQSLVRAFSYDYDDVNGEIDRGGPDGQTTHIELNETGRTRHVSRGGMMVDYTYYSTGGVHTVTNGNGSRATYSYDDASRLTEIKYDWAASGDLILKLAYGRSADGLITSVIESDATGVVAVVTYEYDNRNRLIDEERAITSPYHLSYTYDQLGNRLTKVDHAVGLTTTYHYDVEDPQTYGTLNNRLMYYDVHDASAALVERVDYQYDPSMTAGANGSPTFIVRKRANEAFYRGTTLQYQENGSLWFLIEQVWPNDDEYCDFREVVSIKEVRGAGRGRYVTRQRNPEDPFEIVAGTSVWSDYDGDSIYGDFAVDEQTGSVTELTGYLPGVSQYDAQTGEIRYFHADQIGTVRVVTNDFGQVIARSVSTAFGESVHADGTVGTRYQYAGAWGYEAFEDTPFVHVGFRWYDPSTGRFLQRDPIGIRGGWNTYDYCAQYPVGLVDPNGQTIIVAHWRPGANILIGHTVAFSTKTGAYLSFVPTPFPLPCSASYIDRPISEDIKKYGDITDFWVFDGVDEDAFSDVACQYDGANWCPGDNCITAVTRALNAAGVPGRPTIWMPDSARDFLDKAEKQMGGGGIR